MANFAGFSPSSKQKFLFRILISYMYFPLFFVHLILTYGALRETLLTFV